METFSDKQPSIDPQLLSLPGDKTPEEAKLENEACFGTPQRYQYNMYRLNQNQDAYDGVASLLELEQLLQSNAQKEVELKKILGKQSLFQIGIWSMLNSMALDRLKKRNWTLHQDWWYWSGYVVGRSGHLKRAFELWRDNPMWYMHPALVEDCIGRGGCCGRECGCCVAPQRANSSAGQLGVGHCTLDCGCCSKNRGFKLSWKQQGDYHETFEFSNELDEEQEEEEQDDGEHDDEKQDDEEKGKEKHDSNDGFKNKNATGFSSYHFRYYLASIWGISVDDAKCPAKG